MKLHLGCGPNRLEGWVNLDIRFFAAVDVVADVVDGLPFSSASTIFAEHFIEHLELHQAQALLTECRRILTPNGVLRLSTPNLDWVWAIHYTSRWRALSSKTATIDPEAWRHDDESAINCLELNKAFRGWGHKFLFNRAMLTEAIHSAGFAEIEWCTYGTSHHPELSNLDRKERDPDIPGVPYLLIAEASGSAIHRTPQVVSQKMGEYLREIADE